MTDQHEIISEISQGDWYTMQMLKQDLNRLRKLNSEEHRFEIEFDEQALKYFKNKALVV